ncbi:MAG: Vms1/Ankzf1 family peptidyl-tRNA hydrolase [Candidatus Nanohaloarchaea archaeon]|nr:Vms1/Ankzf1 family peptidyl-tRNA hydrolase [Candidatus Nanohaloarchaea archaeon]
MDLFGRKELKQRIEELEEELEEREASFQEERQRLQERLESKSEQAREAAAAKQEAEQKVNRLQDRVRSLKDRLESSTADSEKHQDEKTLTLAQARELTANLERLTYNSSKAFTGYARPEESPTSSSNGDITVIDPYLISHALLPPVPIKETAAYQADGFALERLQEIMSARYGLIHLSAGGSGVAIVEDGEVEDSIIVDADVKAQHKKGGYSQSRFERRRDEQIQEHLDTLMDAAGELLDSGFAQLFAAGNATMIETMSEEHDTDFERLRSGVGKVTDTDDLQQSFNEGFRFQLVRLHEDEEEAAEDLL